MSQRARRDARHGGLAAPEWRYIGIIEGMVARPPAFAPPRREVIPPAPHGGAPGTGLDGEDASRPIINVFTIRVVSTIRVILGYCRKIKSQVSQISPICRSIRPSYPGPDGDWRVNAINRLLGRKTPDRRIRETVFFHVFRTIDVSQIDHHRASHQVPHAFKI
jgi:hypothetical protein